jgi:NAD(P)-dependent dehydrogenase (short-subunit alcohol dehydrogenase family)
LRFARVSTVLITGAGRGIGRAVALTLAQTGWEVHAAVRRVEDGESLVHDAPASTITPLPLDVTDSAQIAALEEALPRRLDAIINNAGIVVDGRIEALALEDLRRQLEVNVVGQVAVTQAVLPLLRESRGRIVFMSSVSDRMSAPRTGAYNASKPALEGLADSLRIELRPWGISRRSRSSTCWRPSSVRSPRHARAPATQVGAISKVQLAMGAVTPTPVMDAALARP